MNYRKYIKDKKVFETKLRFCLETSCTSSIASSLSNIRLLAGTIMKDPSLNEILQAELDRIKDRGFIIEGINSIQ